MLQTYSKQLSAFVLLVGIAIGFGGGYVLGVRAEINSLPAAVSAATGANEVPPQNIDLTPVWRAWHEIDAKFVPAAVATSSNERTPEEAEQDRVWGMIQGLASSLNDPYTFFLPPAESKAFEEEISGSFEGVGMEIEIRDGVLTIVSPLKGTPAERAGLQSGDRILKINGEETRNLDVSEAVKRIRGPRGTEVTFIIAREGASETQTVIVVRDVINVPIIETEMLEGGVFHIHLLSFSATSPELFRGALREFIESGSTKLILDLRGNPGGYLEASVDMASWFLPSGKIVVTEDYAENRVPIHHRSRGYDVFNEHLNMVILLDKGSASASEILAGALRYWGKGVLIGTTSYGKGSVQELVPITDDTSLKITVARWLNPGGVPIPTTGIVPDIEVKLTPEEIKAKNDKQLKRAVEYLQTGK